MDQEQQQPLQGERLSFGIRTVISVVVQVILFAVFLFRLDGKITRLDEIVADIKSEQKSEAKDQTLRASKMEADIALINIRIAVLENQLHIQPSSQKP